MMLDLDRSQQCRHAPGGGPVETLLEPVQQSGTIGIAAAGWIGDLGGRCHRDLEPFPAAEDPRAGRSARDDQRLHPRRNLFQRPAGALRQQAALVIVDGHPGRPLDEATELLAAEHRQALARIEHEWQAGGRKLFRVLEHTGPPVRGHDTQPDAAAITDPVEVRMVHRSGVKCGDLVVVQIGGDECLSGEFIGQRAHMRARDAAAVEPRGIGTEIVTYGGHDQPAAAE